VKRSGQGVSVTTRDGEEYHADRLINTIPMDAFCAISDATAAEQRVADSIGWAGYTTTLLSVESWAHTAPVNAWSDTCASDAKDGQLLFSRFECEGEDGRLLFAVGQSSAAYSKSELSELAAFSARERGAVDPRIVQQVIWQYMPTYSRQAIRDGLLQTMIDMQGERHTFHTGASFSHEAVSTISTFNARLLSKAVS
jgi:predicted NAD/FAD-binding protein